VFESLAVVGEASLTLPEGNVPRANRATITVEGAAIRFRVDGVTPTAGHRVAPGGVVVLDGTTEIKGFRAIGPGATLRITYERRGALV
jgi:hypothetical protein